MSYPNPVSHPPVVSYLTSYDVAPQIAEPTPSPPPLETRPTLKECPFEDLEATCAFLAQKHVGPHQPLAIHSSSGLCHAWWFRPNDGGFGTNGITICNRF